MKIIPDKIKRRIVIEMSEREWLQFESRMILAPIIMSDDNEEQPEDREDDKTDNVVENVVAEITTESIHEKQRSVRKSRVENLFPGFKRPEPKKITAKGLLNVRCEHCNKPTIFLAREAISEFECRKCGELTKFYEELKRVDYSCSKCGCTGWFYTNTDGRYSIKCKMCGDFVSGEC